MHPATLAAPQALCPKERRCLPHMRGRVSFRETLFQRKPVLCLRKSEGLILSEFSEQDTVMVVEDTVLNQGDLGLSLGSATC